MSSSLSSREEAKGISGWKKGKSENSEASRLGRGKCIVGCSAGPRLHRLRK